MIKTATIYQLVNPEQEIYIGSSRIPFRRKACWKQIPKKHTKIFESIKKYGFDKHQFKVLKEFQYNDKKEIFYFEEAFISVYQYLDIKLLNEALLENQRELKIKRNSRLKELEKIYEVMYDIPVRCLSTPSMEVFKKFKTIGEAADYFKTSKRIIKRAIINEKKHGGFFWKLVDENDMKRLKPKFNKGITVYQLDPVTDEVINCFSSISEARRNTRINGGNITSCLNKDLLTAGGFRWAYRSDLTYKQHNNFMKRVGVDIGPSK